MAAGPGRIVLVHPEPERREAIAHALSQAGLEVAPTGTGREALRLARPGRSVVLVAGRPVDLPTADLADAAAGAGVAVVDLVEPPDPSPDEPARRAQAALAGLGDAVGLFDRRGGLLLANPAMERLLEGSSGSMEAWAAAGRGRADGWPLPRALGSGRRVVEEWTAGRRRFRVAADPLPAGVPGGAAAVVSVAELGPPRLEAVPASADGRDAEDRIAQLEQDVRLLRQFSSDARPAAPAEPLGRRNPSGFCLVVERYERIMDQVLEQRAYRVDHHTGDALRALGEYLGSLGAGPRDVIEVHSMALRRKSATSSPARSHAYAAEGRIMVLELMGNLVAYYRPPAAVAAGGPADQPGASPQ